MKRTDLELIVADLNPGDPVLIQRKNFLLISGAGKSCPSNYPLEAMYFVSVHYVKEKLDGIKVSDNSDLSSPDYFYYSKIGRLEKRK